MKNEISFAEFAAAQEIKKRKAARIVRKAILLAVSCVCSPVVYFFGDSVGALLNTYYVATGIAAAVAVILSSALSLVATVIDTTDSRLRERLNGVFSLRAFATALQVANILFMIAIVILFAAEWADVENVFENVW